MSSVHTVVSDYSAESLSYLHMRFRNGSDFEADSLCSIWASSVGQLLEPRIERANYDLVQEVLLRPKAESAYPCRPGVREESVVVDDSLSATN